MDIFFKILSVSSVRGPTCCGGYPSKSKGSSSEISVSEDVGEAELFVVGLWMQVQKVGHVHVGDAEGIRLASIGARRLIVDLDTLNLLKKIKNFQI